MPRARAALLVLEGLLALLVLEGLLVLAALPARLDRLARQVPPARQEHKDRKVIQAHRSAPAP